MNTHFYKCRCFLTNNYFLKSYNLHVTFISRQQIQRDYEKVLSIRGCNTDEKWNAVIRELEIEYERRRSLDKDARTRREAIEKQYSRMHADVYELQEMFLHSDFLKLVNECKKSKPLVSKVREFLQDVEPGKRLYRLVVFTEEFCRRLIEEFINFDQSPCPKGRPNTMNMSGILLNELGMDTFISDLRERYLEPVCRYLFPDWVGESGLDSHKAFVVIYKTNKEEDLDYHFDNCEVTLNLCLGRTFTDGQLYFGDANTTPLTESTCVLLENIAFTAILHRGRQLHGTLPIGSGERYNMLIWMRSSSIRNTMCPMCGKLPTLMEGDGFADGFTELT